VPGDGSVALIDCGGVITLLAGEMIASDTIGLVDIVGGVSFNDGEIISSVTIGGGSG